MGAMEEYLWFGWSGKASEDTHLKKPQITRRMQSENDPAIAHSCKRTAMENPWLWNRLGSLT